MATKKISELISVTSTQNTDLLVVETADGTRSISINSFLNEIPVSDNVNNAITNAVETVKVKSTSIYLVASNWSGQDIFTQSITINGITTNSKIDLQPNNTVISQMISDGVSAMYVENNNGTLTVYALGSAPTVDLNIQVTITEVESI